MKHILLIEDEGIIALQLSQMIETGGDYRVSIALNGREGLDLHAEDPADLVITDLNMPGVDGFEVIRQIGALTRDQDCRAFGRFAGNRTEGDRNGSGPYPV